MGLLVLFAACPVTRAQQANSLLTNGDFSAPLKGTWKWRGPAAANPTVADVTLPDAGAPGHAFEVTLQSGPNASPWSPSFASTAVTTPIQKGDLICFSFWAMSSEKTRCIAVMQRASAPFDKSIRQVTSLGPDWKKFVYYGQARDTYPAGSNDFEFELGQSSGTIAIASVTALDLGTISQSDAEAQYGKATIDYYGGETPDDSWLPAAEARIEKYRKADLSLTVTDANGKPVPGATITLTETHSAFRWGTAVNSMILDPSPDGDRYRAVLKKLFNTATLENDLKWRATDGNPKTQARVQDELAWLNTNGFQVRGHNLVWGSPKHYPERLSTLSGDALKAEIANRVKDGIASTHGQVYIWDVVNEAGAETELWERTGWDYFPEVYRLARAADPSIQLAYNDYNIANEAPDGGLLRHKVEDRIQRLLDAGAPVDVLGDQAHMGIPLTPIPRVLEIWDDWGQRFKKPLEITEFDASIPDDTVHEKYVRDFVTAAFSDPNVQSFVMWGFWEKAQYAGAAGCLFRADWSPRPAEVTFENLVLNQWRTNLTLTTDAAGNATTRAFLGDYDVQVSANGETQTVKLTVTAAGTQETIRLP